MNSNASKIVAAVAAIALVAVLFFVFRGDEDTNPTADTVATTQTTTAETTGSSEPDGREEPKREPKVEVPTVEVEAGQPVGGLAKLTFTKGDEIRFVVASDTADEIHVHGYDVYGDVEAGGEAEFDFPADLEGIFEVELHGTGTQIAELTVNP